MKTVNVTKDRKSHISQSIQYGYNAPALENGDIKMVRISDIQDNKVLWEKVPFCLINTGEIETYLLKVNDILFARTGGTVGNLISATLLSSHDTTVFLRFS